MMSEDVSIVVTDTTSAAQIVEQKGWGYSLCLTLAAMVGGLASVCIKQLLLPIQISSLDPLTPYTSLAIVASCGAAAGLIATPLFGAFSDRTTWRFGRRRPWIILGVTGMVLMAQATSIPFLLIGEILAQVGVDMVLAMVTALIPDQVPVSQRPMISALIGMAPNVGGALGLVLVTRFTTTRIIAQGYYLMAAVSLACVCLFLLVLREQPFAREAVSSFHLRRFLVGFFQPLRSADFTCVLLSRGLVYLSFTLLGTYTLFYFRTVLHFTTVGAAQGLSVFQLISTSVLFVVAIGVGFLTHKKGRPLKPFVAIGAIAMAIGLLVIAFVANWSAIILAAIIFGGGFGAYLGVDVHLAIQVLPRQADRAKDLGIFYGSIFLALIVSPLLGGFILNVFHNNFALLFALAAVFCLLAAGLILPMRSVQ